MGVPSVWGGRGGRGRYRRGNLYHVLYGIWDMVLLFRLTLSVLSYSLYHQPPFCPETVPATKPSPHIPCRRPLQLGWGFPLLTLNCREPMCRRLHLQAASSSLIESPLCLGFPTGSWAGNRIPSPWMMMAVECHVHAHPSICECFIRGGAAGPGSSSNSSPVLFLCGNCWERCFPLWCCPLPLPRPNAALISAPSSGCQAP